MYVYMYVYIYIYNVCVYVCVILTPMYTLKSLILIAKGIYKLFAVSAPKI